MIRPEHLHSKDRLNFAIADACRGIGLFGFKYE